MLKSSDTISEMLLLNRAFPAIRAVHAPPIRPIGFITDFPCLLTFENNTESGQNLIWSHPQ
jgi:hypothetical protein